MATLVSGCAAQGQPSAIGIVDGGSIDGVPVNTLKVIEGHPVALARDEQGLYAMSTICTHKQCDIRNDGSISWEGLHCDCHGSEFDRNGTVLDGPADDPLDHYRVELADDGSIRIDADALVGASERTPVPS